MTWGTTSCERMTSDLLLLWDQVKYQMLTLFLWVYLWFDATCFFYYPTHFTTRCHYVIIKIAKNKNTFIPQTYHPKNILNIVKRCGKCLRVLINTTNDNSRALLVLYLYPNIFHSCRFWDINVNNRRIKVTYLLTYSGSSTIITPKNCIIRNFNITIWGVSLKPCFAHI